MSKELHLVESAFGLFAVETLKELKPELKTDEILWSEFCKYRNLRPSPPIPFNTWLQQGYIFYHELQELYGFAAYKLPETTMDEFFRLCGQKILLQLFQNDLPDFIRAALFTQEKFSDTIATLAQKLIGRYRLEAYSINVSTRAHTIIFNLRHKNPQLMKSLLRKYNIDQQKAFQNSCQVFFGIFQTFWDEFIKGGKTKAELHVKDYTATVTLYVSDGIDFDYQKIIGALSDYAEKIKSNSIKVLSEQRDEYDLLLSSPVMREIWDMIKTAAQTDELILLRGEGGTGKSYLAKRIHEISRRLGRPFVEVGLTSDLGSDNMIQSQLFGHTKGAFTGAVEEKQGLFTIANGGTIFLDEIGDASHELQSRLLRVIESKTFKQLGGTKDIKVDVRIIAATNKNLEDLVKQGKFREDLYYRMNVISITLPPLRERRGEILLLSNHFLKKICNELNKQPKKLSNEVNQVLESYRWSGNLRELIHCLRYGVVMSKNPEIKISDIPDSIRKAKPLTKFVETENAGNVIEFDRLVNSLKGIDKVTIGKDAKLYEFPWHVEYAKRMYLLALIHHFKGNIRSITNLWENRSEKTVRALIKKYDLEHELETARKEP